MGICVLFLRECSALLQVGAGAEAGVDLAGENECSCRPRLAFVVNAVDLLVQLRKQLSRNRIARCGPVHGEDANVPRVRRGIVDDIEDGRGRARVRTALDGAG